MTHKKYLITSALPYINGIKHLGNFIGSLLPADIYARYLRQQGRDVLAICGTDEHGAPAEIAASEAGESISDYCDAMYQVQKSIYDQLDLSFDYFGRTSTESNKEITQAIFLQLDNNGFINTKHIKQYYSIDDSRYLPDRYIIGQCPFCEYDKARGDQCDGCGSLLDPSDLIDPQSVLNPSSHLELRETEHLFLNLPKLQDAIAAWAKTLEKPSKLVAGLLKKWLDTPLTERCITRDLSWGIPVPKKGFEDKVFYVWFDAPHGYISITKDWAESIGTPNAWQSWWKEGNNVDYTQFMAKDNVPFHAIFWPAILLGANDDWKMVDTIKAFDWLTYEGGKFSTSQKKGVFLDQALALYPSDYWRYYLVANAPETSDSDFSFEEFARTINNDLADVLGNFVSRVLALINKHFASQIPAFNKHESDKQLTARVIDLSSQIDHAYQHLQYRKAANLLKELWACGNEYISKAQPWSVVKDDKVAAGHILATCLHLITLYAVISSPIIPATSKKLFGLLGLSDCPSAITIKQAMSFDVLPATGMVADKLALFEKIEAETVTQLTKEFAGKSEISNDDA